VCVVAEFYSIESTRETSLYRIVVENTQALKKNGGGAAAERGVQEGTRAEVLRGMLRSDV